MSPIEKELKHRDDVYEKVQGEEEFIKNENDKVTEHTEADV